MEGLSMLHNRLLYGSYSLDGCSTNGTIFSEMFVYGLTLVVLVLMAVPVVMVVNIHGGDHGADNGPELMALLLIEYCTV